MNDDEMPTFRVDEVFADSDEVAALRQRVAELQAEVARLRSRPEVPTLPQWLFDAARTYPADKCGIAIGFAGSAWVAAWEARGAAESGSADPAVQLMLTRAETKAVR